MPSMKARDFSSFLGTLAEVLNAASAPTAGHQIKTLATIFDAHPTSSVSQLTQRIALSIERGPSGSPSTGDVARLLVALKTLPNKAAKTGLLTDISSIETVLRDRTSMELSAFVRAAIEVGGATSRPARKRATPARKRATPAVRDDLVLHYKERLEASLGTEAEFTAAYNDLRTDAAMGKAELNALAKQMTGAGARTEDAARKKIWNRHQSLMISKAKSRATGGRSAA